MLSFCCCEVSYCALARSLSATWRCRSSLLRGVVLCPRTTQFLRAVYRRRGAVVYRCCEVSYCALARRSLSATRRCRLLLLRGVAWCPCAQFIDVIVYCCCVSLLLRRSVVYGCCEVSFVTRHVHQTLLGGIGGINSFEFVPMEDVTASSLEICGVFTCYLFCSEGRASAAVGASWAA